ncbi:transporter substrate-binding domain-containing protein [Duganella sp. FT92W]|uniref:Transporter substrate-binding domain-containing protein n=1 Tax=Pseudoduganella rivuli TaxID=2666085 RepID=A0A7X2ITP3_9BURK|nr:ABC transporter substrate-binding protein [Pseudoduganella rivuli]MRV75829.1 transporter substrate-binding domain-containing protein [Pseudoduganella rivuli]
MKRRPFLTFAALSAALPHAGAAPLAAMRIVTTHLPPLVLENQPKRPGALQELVAELCKRAGLSPDTAFVPWRRALFLATTMPATAIYPLTRLPEREAQFRWLAPLYDEHYVFVAPRGKRFDIGQPERMKNTRIAILRGAAQIVMLRELGYHHFVEARSIDEVHRFLVGGMADASFGERNIIRASLKSRHAEADFDVSAPVRTTTAWLAGSLDFTADDAQLFKRLADAMAADGASKKILAKYGLE